MLEIKSGPGKNQWETGSKSQDFIFFIFSQRHFHAVVFCSQVSDFLFHFLNNYKMREPLHLVPSPFENMIYIF